MPKVRSTLAAAGVAAALLAVPAGTSATDASWTDSEFGTSALTAATIPPPAIKTCSLDPGPAGTNPVITVTWQFQGGGYSAPANVNYYGNTAQVTPGSNLTTTGPDAQGIYTTEFKAGILGGLLGGTYSVSLQTKDGSGWVSTLATATASMGLGGSNAQCTVN